MPRKFERAAVLIALVVSPWCLSALQPSVASPIRLGLAALFEPALQVVQDFRNGFSTVVMGIFQGPILLEENRLLRNQVATLLAHEETHNQLARENARLKALLEFKADTAWRFAPAEVIGREWGPWSRTVLLNKGRNDGIQTGMAVMTHTGLIGRISEVGPSLSRVLLLTDPHFRVSARVSLSGVMGLGAGTSAGEMMLTYVPLEAQLKPGEKIFTAGGRSFCPEGIPIGVIQSVAVDSSRLFQFGRIRPVVNFSALQEVLIVTWPLSDSVSS